MGVRLTVKSSWSEATGSVPCVFEFDQERVTVGRSAGSDVLLPHQAVSGQHATFRAQGAGWVVQDEGSTNGTRVNGSAIPPGRPKPLRTGDIVDVGGFAVRVEVGVAVTAATSVDRTSALARRLVRELVDPEGTAPPPRLLVLNGPDEGKALDVPEPPARLLVGRGESCDLALKDADASREHAEIVRDLDGVIVRDLGSKNGVLVNDRRVTERRLRDRDEVLVGATVLVYEDVAETMLREIAAEPDRKLDTPPPPAPEPAADDAPPDEPAPTDSKVDTAAVADETPEPTAPRARGAGADVLIYLLAAAVLALSIAGLVILLSAG